MAARGDCRHTMNPTVFGGRLRCINDRGGKFSGRNIVSAVFARSTSCPLGLLFHSSPVLATPQPGYYTPAHSSRTTPARRDYCLPPVTIFGGSFERSSHLFRFGHHVFSPPAQPRIRPASSVGTCPGAQSHQWNGWFCISISQVLKHQLACP